MLPQSQVFRSYVSPAPELNDDDWDYLAASLYIARLEFHVNPGATLPETQHGGQRQLPAGQQESVTTYSY